MSNVQLPFLLITSGCHLCEQAITLCSEIGVTPELIDIVEDDRLVELYGDKIPVLMFNPAEPALYWPFTALQLKQYLKHYGIS